MISLFAAALMKALLLPGTGGWDYLTYDSTTNQVFVTHGDQVVVIDATGQKIVGTLLATGSHGVAIAPDLHRGFISNGKANTVTVFDLDKLTVLATIPVGQNPDAICYEPVTHHVFAFNGHSGTASEIDASCNKIDHEIVLDGRPEFAAADGRGFVYDNLEDKSEVLKIDAATGTVVARWSLPADSGPSALSVDAADHLLFSSCHNAKTYVIDMESGKTIDTLDIANGVDASVYDPQSHLLLVTCGTDAKLCVFRVKDKTTKSVNTYDTVRGVRTLAYNPTTHAGYFVAAEYDPNTPAGARPTIKPGTVKLVTMPIPDMK